MRKAAARGADDDLFQWTIDQGDFPSASEANPGAPPAPPPMPARPLPRAVSRFSGLLGGAALGLILGVWLTAHFDELRQQAALRQIVAQEETAAQARDLKTLQRLSDPTAGVWQAQRLQRIDDGLPAPLPIHSLRQTQNPAQFQSITSLTTHLMQVEMARQYAAPDGTRYTFITPQFYRRVSEADNDWKRTAAPVDYWGVRMRLTGRYVALDFYSVDGDLAEALLPGLDETLARACGAWPCPPNARITVTFDNYSFQSAADLAARDDASAPALMALLPPVVSRNPSYALVVPSPHDAGYPADEASFALLQRSLALQLIFAAADRLAFDNGANDQTGNALFYALVLRLTARFGLDAPSVLTAPPIPVEGFVDAEVLWNFRSGVWQRPDLVRGGLAMLNEWLAGQPPASEVALLRGFSGARSLTTWLADGTGVSLRQAQAEVDAAWARWQRVGLAP